MPTAALRSLKHEYELFLDAEIERYKESVPRSVILKIADDAVSGLRAQPQYGLEELTLCDEVNRIIRSRLGLPTYESWRRKRLKIVNEYKRPERWGLRPDAPLVREIRTAAEAHVLVAGNQVERAALYLAANGCAVTALDDDEDALERVVFAASPAGLNWRLRARVGSLGNWNPDVPLTAVVCSADELRALAPDELARVIKTLQAATKNGGVHLVESAASDGTSLDELRARYTGWVVAVEDGSDSIRSFVARKNAA